MAGRHKATDNHARLHRSFGWQVPPDFNIGVVCCTGGTARVPRIADEIRRRLPAARMEQFKGFHSVVEGLAREAQAIEGGRLA